MRIQRRWWVALMTMLAVSGIVATVGYGSGQRAHGGDTLKIGSTLPLTGKESRAGGLYKQGYQLAIDRVNAAGGLKVGNKKLKVELDLQDDRTDQTSVVSLTRKVIFSDNVDVMLSSYSTDLVIAQAPIAESAGIPFVSGGGAAGDIYRPAGHTNKWIFGTISSIHKMSGLTADWIAHEQNLKKLPKGLKVALVVENTAHGQDYREGLRAWARKYPGRIKIVLDDQFELNASDFTGLLQRVKASGAKALLVDAHLPDFINMQRTYLALGLKMKVLSYGARGSEASAKAALGSGTDYIISAAWWAPLKNAANNRFIAAFKAAYGTDPEWYSALAYDSARVLMAAVSNAGSLDRNKIRVALTKLNFTGSVLPRGTIRFLPINGYQATNGFVVTQNFPNGTTSIIWPPKVATAKGAVVP